MIDMDIGSGRKIVVMASGRGTTFEAIARATLSGKINAEIGALICNNPTAGAIDIAKNLGIRYHIIPRGGKRMNQKLEKLLDQLSPDLVVLAGFLKIIPPHIIERYREKIINTHPSLLPCFGGMGFYGIKVHESVIASGAKFSGCTVHFVSDDVDGGPIISQEVVPVSGNDDAQSLERKVHEKELDLIVRTIRDLLGRKYRIVGKRVIFYQ